MTTGGQLPLTAATTLIALWGDDRPRGEAYVRELRRRGYSLGAIANPLGISRQRLHQLEQRWAQRGDVAPRGALKGLYIPTKVGSKRERNRETVTVEQAAMVLGLWTLSSRVRGSTRPDTLEAQSVPLMAATLKELHRQGVTLPQVADATGIPTLALKRRLARYRRRDRAQAPTQAD